MTDGYSQIHPDMDPVLLGRLLGAFHGDTIWQWNLVIQDLLAFPREQSFLGKCPSFRGAQSLLDVFWGKGQPFVSHAKDFPSLKVCEVGLSMQYLFQGSTKAKQILRDIFLRVESRPQFDWIRLCLVAQHVRHHGLLLAGLKELLSDRGHVLIVDARDHMIDFYPNVPYISHMYEELKVLQKNRGGLRSGSERIQKRASTFGFRLELAEECPIQTKTAEECLHFFRMLCLHVEIITRSFPGKFNREHLIDEALKWYQHDKCWGQFGMHFVAIEKKRVVSKRKRILRL